MFLFSFWNSRVTYIICRSVLCLIVTHPYIQLYYGVMCILEFAFCMWKMVCGSILTAIAQFQNTLSPQKIPLYEFVVYFCSHSQLGQLTKLAVSMVLPFLEISYKWNHDRMFTINKTCVPMVLPFLEISHKWNHNCMCLTFSTWHNVFEVLPCCMLSLTSPSF